ncbi:hypothetical protein [Paludisphaera mucosa]|uniref:Uncharacterized protein n=1 Tax=Paludisphaera mucosa TaxID=3030827 RepID=A0ABT6FEY8_9BACT|nr:hypothetical protein [Paludisphaera mucosa]MDG3006143.1 hypothetical protein [Paludisphaera mucosa]
MSRITWSVPTSTASVSSVATSTHATRVTGSFVPTAGGFMVAGPWAAVYRLAYEQALAATQPSKFQKMLEPCWN